MTDKIIIPFAWEELNDTTWRAKIIGGWLISNGSHGVGISTTFISDPEWRWATGDLDVSLHDV